MEIVTRQCIIRNFKAEDSRELYETLSDGEVMKYMEPPYTMEQVKSFIEEAGVSKLPLIYALTSRADGKVIGHVIYHKYDEESCEFGWVLNHDFWGRGIASEVTEALLNIARQDGWKSCVMECVSEQEATKHIARKFGFTYEGMEDGLEIYRYHL